MPTLLLGQGVIPDSSLPLPFFMSNPLNNPVGLPPSYHRTWHFPQCRSSTLLLDHSACLLTGFPFAFLAVLLNTLQPPGQETDPSNDACASQSSSCVYLQYKSYSLAGHTSCSSSPASSVDCPHLSPMLTLVLPNHLYLAECVSLFDISSASSLPPPPAPTSFFTCLTLSSHP